jgi:hypothetical protein
MQLQASTQLVPMRGDGQGMKSGIQERTNTQGLVRGRAGSGQNGAHCLNNSPYFNLARLCATESTSISQSPSLHRILSLWRAQHLESGAIVLVF